MGCSKLSSLGGLVQGTGGYELGTDMQQYARRGNSPVAEEVTGKQIKAGIKCNDGERADHDYSTFPVANFRPQLSRQGLPCTRLVDDSLSFIKT